MPSIKIISQYLAPKHLLSRLMAIPSNSKISWLKNFLIHTFIKKYQVNMSEAIKPTANDYETFNDFFTRHLKPGCRPISEATIVSPADGSICEFGNIENQTLLQAKNHSYTLSALLANNPAMIKQFDGGSYLTVYLAPKDYHRVHMPYNGKIAKMIHVPGNLYSVNIETAKNIPNIFANNERVITLFNSDLGPFAVILVGACLVAGIHIKWHGQVSPRKSKGITSWSYPNQDTLLKKGDELGHFQFGSTAIILFPKNTVAWNKALAVGSEVTMGQGVGC